jgi:hypothetical protein
MRPYTFKIILLFSQSGSMLTSIRIVWQDMKRLNRLKTPDTAISICCSAPKRDRASIKPTGQPLTISTHPIAMLYRSHVSCVCVCVGVADEAFWRLCILLLILLLIFYGAVASPVAHIITHICLCRQSLFAGIYVYLYRHIQFTAHITTSYYWYMSSYYWCRQSLCAFMAPQ